MGDEGLSSLRWVFDRYIVGEIGITLRGGSYRKTLYDHEYHLSLSTLPLGFLITEPILYQQSAFSFSTPLVLLAGLARGETEPPGTRIMGRSSGLTRYEVDFDKAIPISDGFLKFVMDACQGQSLSQGLLAKGLADPMTATIIERRQRLQLAPGQSSELRGVLSKMSSSYGVDELLAALAGLGFSQEEARAAIEKAAIPPDLSSLSPAISMEFPCAMNRYRAACSPAIL